MFAEVVIIQYEFIQRRNLAGELIMDPIGTIGNRKPLIKLIQAQAHGLATNEPSQLYLSSEHRPTVKGGAKSRRVSD